MAKAMGIKDFKTTDFSEADVKTAVTSGKGKMKPIAGVNRVLRRPQARHVNAAIGFAGNGVGWGECVGLSLVPWQAPFSRALFEGFDNLVGDRGRVRRERDPG